MTAKGYGLVAERIVEIAAEQGIVVETDPALAQALAGVELDETIPVEHFEAVAEVIGFVLRAGRQAGLAQPRSGC